jgi:peptidoglycan/LPS O-acetylase OafA/YrhL
MPGSAGGVRRGQPQLDGLRALAVAEVVAFHAQSRLLPSGYIGVDVFLVLSGFLIAGLLAREYERTGTIRLWRFYARRALRLLPALFLVSGVMIVAALAFPGLRDRSATMIGAVAALTYLSSPLAASGGDLGDFLPTWSLSVQEYFYAVWPLAMLLVLRWRRRFALLFVGIATCVAAAYTLAVPVLLGWSEQRISYGSDTRVVQLLIGVVIALGLARTGARVPTCVAVASAALLVGYLALPLSVSERFYFDGGQIVVALVAGTVIMHLTSDRSVMTRLLSWAPLVWIGRRSYGIYLWNLPLGALLSLTPLPLVPRAATKLILTVLVPALSYMAVEQPLLRLRRFLDTPTRLQRRGPTTDSAALVGSSSSPTGSTIGGPVAQRSAVVPRL